MRFFLAGFFLFSTNFMIAQINLNKLKSATLKAKEVISTKDLTNKDIVSGLKAALILGAREATNNASSHRGFLNNSLIRIPFPKDAKNMKKTLLNSGMHLQIENFEIVLNEAAEDAAYFAEDIFVNAVKSMKISDALSILKGNDNAATIYLKTSTKQDLYAKFKPVVRNSINKVGLNKIWTFLTENYNKIPFTKKINTDLEDYVTNKAILGLFILIENEEYKIRNNPMARSSDILKKVFK